MSFSGASKPPSEILQVPPLIERLARKTKIQLFHEIADDLKIRVEFIMRGHIVRMYKGNDRIQIIGYSFGLNKAAAARICSDKSAASAILEIDKVPHVEHVLASECDMEEEAKRYGYNLVCKPNGGQNGDGVVRVRKPQDLQKAIATISKVCLSPYYEIEHEYRVVMLNHVPQIIFEKVKPQIIGNGHSTVAQLLGNFYASTPPAFLKKMKDFDPGWLPLATVLKNGEAIHLQWKHSAFNARLLDPDKESSLICKISPLAMAATRSLDISFCCADIVALKGGELRVLEVNSSVWLEEEEIGYLNVKKIYTAAVSLMFNSGAPESEEHTD